MAVDHIGYVFFPDKMWLRIIGRIAFPLLHTALPQGAYIQRTRKNMQSVF